MKETKLKEVLARIEAGESVRAACKAAKMSTNTLYAYCKRHGAPLRSKFIWKPYALGPEERLAIAAEYAAGGTTSGIAKRLNLCHHTVAGYVKLHSKIRTKEDNRRRNGHPVIKSMMASYRGSRAAQRYGFELTYQEFAALVVADCAYCGAKPQLRHYKRRGQSESLALNGIDRINNSRGYERRNVLTACSQCNFAKNDLDPRQFLGWIAGMLTHWMTTFTKTSDRESKSAYAEMLNMLLTELQVDPAE